MEILYGIDILVLILTGGWYGYEIWHTRQVDKRACVFYLLFVFAGVVLAGLFPFIWKIWFFRSSQQFSLVSHSGSFSGAKKLAAQADGYWKFCGCGFYPVF